jgi:hypothetical protein
VAHAFGFGWLVEQAVAQSGAYSRRRIGRFGG